MQILLKDYHVINQIHYSLHINLYSNNLHSRLILKQIYLYLEGKSIKYDVPHLTLNRN
jgi:hypothetical protein